MLPHRRHDQRCGPVLRWVLTCLLALALGSRMASAQAPPHGTDRYPRTATQADRSALATFHMNLSALESGKRKTLAVLQIGDSHTAADHFTGRLRNLLQKRFGNAGRGFMPPGTPHAWYRPYQVVVTQSAGWKILTSNRLNPDRAAYGLSGSIAVANDPADVITIDLKPETDARILDVGLLAEPGNGALNVFADGQLVAALPSHEGDGLNATRLGLPVSTRHLELRPAGNGPVKLADHALLTGKPGVTVSNIGFIGAQVSLLTRWYWPRVISQIADMDPALIVLAFGTNEGHAPVAKIAADYEFDFEHRIRALKAAAPNASLVVVGPPDAGRYPRYCLPNQSTAAPADSGPATQPTAPPLEAGQQPTTVAPQATTASKPPMPPPEPPADAVCKPLSLSERTSYDRLLASEDRTLCRWHTPAAFPVVRRIQREVAARQGALFFDWFEVFDGECGADQWFRQGLAHKDRVHFKQDGYWRVADRLHARLLSGYPPTAAPQTPPKTPR